ncbi:MAG: hypothetical protein E7292_12805 [Lachnospiraceae bacterium]|nr:hypothetical protein [Lachnospiraceae bacterium]
MVMVFALFLIGLLVLGAIGLLLLVIGLLMGALSIRKTKRLKDKEQYTHKMAGKYAFSCVLIVLGSVLTIPAICLLVINGGLTIYTDNADFHNLEYQIRYGTAEDVERVLKEGAPAESAFRYERKNIAAEGGESTVFHYLMYANNIEQREEKIQLLINYGADIERRQYECDGSATEHTSEDGPDNYGCGETPLMIACYANEYDAVKVLLENGADVNAMDHHGKTPLVYVIHKNDYNSDETLQAEIVKLLLEYGADPDIRGLYNETALEEARKYEKYEIESVLLKN